MVLLANAAAVRSAAMRALCFLVSRPDGRDTGSGDFEEAFNLAKENRLHPDRSGVIASSGARVVPSVPPRTSDILLFLFCGIGLGLLNRRHAARTLDGLHAAALAAVASLRCICPSIACSAGTSVFKAPLSDIGLSDRAGILTESSRCSFTDGWSAYRCHKRVAFSP